MTKDQYIKLRKSRKVLKQNKIVDYNGKYKELVKSESGFYVYPEEDELLDMIENIDLDNYDFEKLPYRLKRYMKSIDDAMFNIAFDEYENMTRDYFQQLERKEKELYRKVKNPTRRDYEDYVVEGEQITSDYHKAYCSARRAYKNVSSLMKCNLDEFEYFITLTFAEEKNKYKYKRKSERENFELFWDYVDGYDIDQAFEAYRKFMKKMRTWSRRKEVELKYITVWEKHKSGKIHFHIVLNEIPFSNLYILPDWLSIDFETYEKDNQQGLKYWKYGKSEVQHIRDKRKMSTYISKYLVKGFKNIDVDEYNKYLDKKKYFASRKLAKPKESYVNDDKLDKYFDETVSADVETEYSDYMDKKITRKLINT